jgi:hypothetical protein
MLGIADGDGCRPYGAASILEKPGDLGIESISAEAVV